MPPGPLFKPPFPEGPVQVTARIRQARATAQPCPLISALPLPPSRPGPGPTGGNMNVYVEPAPFARPVPSGMAAAGLEEFPDRRPGPGGGFSAAQDPPRHRRGRSVISLGGPPDGIHPLPCPHQRRGNKKPGQTPGCYMVQCASHTKCFNCRNCFLVRLRQE